MLFLSYYVQNDELVFIGLWSMDDSYVKIKRFLMENELLLVFGNLVLSLIALMWFHRVSTDETEVSFVSRSIFVNFLIANSRLEVR